jgi:hypothetical protein
MAVNLTADQVLEMAPDASSAKSGKELANVRKWVVLGCDERSAWGECQGSGANPYQTRIDLTEVVFKCSCPSRKFPCKHGLGLLLLLVENEAHFTQKQAPVWVSQWLDDRQQRTEKKVAKKAEEAAKPVDAAAQAKRVEQRKQKIANGVSELDRWMQDLMRQGLASVQDKPYKFWEEMGARLVDAQAPGLARMVRECGGIPSTGEGWQDRLLERLGKIYLVLEAFSRLDSLPSDLQEEVKTVLGFTTNQDEVLAQQPAVLDIWEVVGQRVEQDDKLRVQRTWLHGRETGRWALVLAFAHGTAPLDTSLVSGTQFRGEIVYFPGAAPLRALVKTRDESVQALKEFGAVTLSSAFDSYSQALATNPWLERYPMSLANVVPVLHGDTWTLVDDNDIAVNIGMKSLGGWQLMALSVGEPLTVFGEWDGNALAPLAVSANKQYVRL